MILGCTVNCRFRFGDCPLIHCVSTSPEFSIDQNIFFLHLSYTVPKYLMTLDLTAVRQEVNNLDSSVVVQELELAMNIAL